MPHTLADKVAIVTGATSGIGEAATVALSTLGAKVLACGRREDRLQALAGRLKKRGNEITTTVTDITDETAVREMMDTCIKHYGSIDILVNNAGVMLLGPVLDADTEDWRRMIHTNVLGLMYATHAVLPHMVKQSSGHIVQISSVAGRTTRSDSAVYNASKWAVNAFTEALRQEVYQHHVRTTLIEPGIVATELREHITHQETRKNIEDWAGSVRQLQPEDIAAAIVFALTQADHVDVNEVLVRPTDQEG
jgi:NADP-dependent 3-hydroxy acid dehydrogenase YdfG